MRRFIAVLAFFFAASAFAMTFTVTNARSSGPGSLQQAILDANNHWGADVITFNVGSGRVGIYSETGYWITDPVNRRNDAAGVQRKSDRGAEWTGDCAESVEAFLRRHDRPLVWKQG